MRHNAHLGRLDYIRQLCSAIEQPNITGTASKVLQLHCDGAFYLSGSVAYDGQNGDNVYRELKFDAARISGVYSRSATVQPLACQILIIIKA